MTTGLLVLGLVVGVIGWVILIVVAFRTTLFWGLAVLVLPLAASFLISNLWVSEVAWLAILFAFAIPHWDRARTGLIVYVVGLLILVPTLFSGGWIEQASYDDDCKGRPPGTVCAKYEDGYVWLVPDNVAAWKTKLDARGVVRVAVGSRGEYEHVLGTQYVRIVRTEAQEAAYREEEARQDRGFEAIPAVPSVAPVVEASVAAVPVRSSRTSPSPPPSADEPVASTAIVQVYVVNKTKRYYPLECDARPPKAYKMAKSLAIRQGFELASECRE